MKKILNLIISLNFLFLVGCVPVLNVEPDLTEQYFDITWKNEDESILAIDSVKYGEFPEYGRTEPTKENGLNEKWFFISWLPAINYVSGEATYTATYLDALHYYVSDEPFLYQTINQEVTITGINKNYADNFAPSGMNLEIPAIINGNKVVGIEAEHFLKYNVLSLKIPNTITSIGYSTFEGSNSYLLKYLILPASLKTLDFGWDYYLKKTLFFEGYSVDIKEPNEKEPASSNIRYYWDRHIERIEDGFTDIIDGRYIFQDEWHYDEKQEPVPNNSNDIYDFDYENKKLSLNEKYQYMFGEIIIPSFYNGERVLKIGSFQNANISSIEISEGIEAIINSFYHNEYLSKISLPSTLKTFILNNFQNRIVKEIIFPEGLEYLYLNTTLESVNFIIIPSTVTLLYLSIYSRISVYISKNSLGKYWTIIEGNMDYIYFENEWHYASSNNPVPNN